MSEADTATLSLVVEREMPQAPEKRLEQSGFRPAEEAAYQGASHGWRRFVGGLERVAAGLDGH
jgi:hypothetical protein